MTSSRTSTGAVLAGSLAAFPLLAVLELLSRTKHSGALQVVGDTVDEQLWVDAGDLLETSTDAAERLFSLAALHDAWFTVIPGQPPSGLADSERVSLEPLIELVSPRIHEWQALTRNLPADSLVKMASSTPGPEVQIRAEQWHILAVIGTGRPLQDVVAAVGAPPLDTLRVVQQLLDQHLVAVESPTSAAGVPIDLDRVPELIAEAPEPAAPEPAPAPRRAPTPAPAPAAAAPAAPAPAAAVSESSPPWRDAERTPVSEHRSPAAAPAAPEPELESVSASAEPAEPYAPLPARLRARSQPATASDRTEEIETVTSHHEPPPPVPAYMPPPVIPASASWSEASPVVTPEVTLAGRRASDQSI